MAPSGDPTGPTEASYEVSRGPIRNQLFDSGFFRGQSVINQLIPDPSGDPTRPTEAPPDGSWEKSVTQAHVFILFLP
jgi:hypothetical protein